MWAVLTAFLLMGAGCSENSTGPDGGNASLVCGDGEAWVITKSEALKLPGGDEFLDGGEEAAFFIDAIDAAGISFRTGGAMVVAVQMTWTDELVRNIVLMDMEEGDDTTGLGMMISTYKIMIQGLGGKWGEKGWYGVTYPVITWSQSGSNLTLTSPDPDDGPQIIPVVISGNKLTVTFPEEDAPPVSLTKKNDVNVVLFDELLNMGGGLFKSIQPGKLLKMKI
jgi:hypothetical protein